MQLVGIISLLAAFSSSTHALVRRGAPEGTPGTIDCAYMINFPDNVDGPAAVKAHFDATKIKYTVRIAFKNKLANFVSVNIDGDCDATKQLSPIKGAVYYSTVRLVERPEPVRRSQSEKKPTPEQIHTITGVNEVRKRFGLTGKGINVAVIDTGVYWRHPAMGGGFGDGFKVAKGYDFVGDKFTGYIDSPPAVEDKDPDDNCDVSSHGTHVAGIVAADARGIKDPAWAPAVPFTGVAPDAKIFAYRVFGCEGVADDDYIAAAIYQAAADGAHILNLSLGFGPAYHDDGTSVAIDKVRRLGHFVIISAGNSGASGSFIHGAPGVAHSAIGVASFDNVAAPQTVIRVDNLPFIYTLGAANGNFAEGEVLDIIVNNLDADAKDVQDDGTKPLNPPVKADGKAMLIRWGSPSLGGSAVRCDYAFNAGAKACILYSDTETMTPNLGFRKNSINVYYECCW
ncbi:peptidase S8/S53 domain-containing protein [Obelidium mucronatum]|nr:peptidase S8/S53 domain-containing protein [Obelidium mucronatum]